MRALIRFLKILFCTLLTLSVCVYLLLIFQPLSPDLGRIDPGAYKIVDELLGNNLVTKKDIRVYVGHSVLMDFFSLAYAVPDTNSIYLSDRLLGDKYLDAILAHEIGHIETGSASQKDADLFAARLIGKYRMIVSYRNHQEPFTTFYKRLISNFDFVYKKKDAIELLSKI